MSGRGQDESSRARMEFNRNAAVYAPPDARETVARGAPPIEPALGRFFDGVLSGRLTPTSAKLRQACDYFFSNPERSDPGGMLSFRGRVIPITSSGDLESVMFLRMGASAYNASRVVTLTMWEGLYRAEPQKAVSSTALAGIEPFKRSDKPVLYDSRRSGPAFLVAPHEQLLVDTDVVQGGCLMAFGRFDRSQFISFACQNPRIGRRDDVWDSILGESSTAERIHTFSRILGRASTICSYVESPFSIPFFPVRALKEEEIQLAHHEAPDNNLKNVSARMYSDAQGQRAISLTNRSSEPIVVHLVKTIAEPKVESTK